jgi:hypothetical protein
VGKANNYRIAIEMRSNKISAGQLDVLTEDFAVFFSLFGMVLSLDHNRFLPNPLHFIKHLTI